MQYKYRKIIYLFLSMVVIYFAIIFVISNLKEDYKESMKISDNVSPMDKMEIHTVEDYLAFAESINSGKDYLNCEVSLQSDLDFSGYDNLVPIGTTGEKGMSFLGTFNGNGYSISGVTIERPGECAGLFVNLGGVVKNLQVKNCIFSGQICGFVATDTVSAAVLNCYVDVQIKGEISGAIIGVLNGRLRNCVSTVEAFTGEIQEGLIDHCYFAGYEDFIELNKNLAHISGYYDDTDFCYWENGLLSGKKADLLKELTARLNVNGAELKFYGYYSRTRGAWCFTLPATYGNELVLLEARTSNGGYQSFTRSLEDQLLIFSWEDRYYPIDFLCDDSVVSVYITLHKQKNLDYVHKNKIEEIPGVLTVIDTEGETTSVSVKGFYGHGNDSWFADKKSYNLKLEAYEDLLNMGANDDFVLIAGYRNGSLMSYVATAEMSKELGFAYAPEFRLINLYVAGEYVGVYFLAEKVEIDQNRIELDSVYQNAKKESVARLDSFDYCSWKDEYGEAERYYYDVPENPKDITGAYLLEADVMDFAADDSRFLSDRRIKFTLKRAKYSSKEQVYYIADYWQDFENALYAENGYNEKGRYYLEYIDAESFAMQWLYYELVQEISTNSSIYFYKESDITGDGLLHACFPWDVEHSYVENKLSKDLWLIGRTSLKGYWKELYRHEDFRQEICRVWNENYVPTIKKLIADKPIAYENGLKNLKWYQENIVGLHYLENSRWETIYLWNRCGEIRDFMEFRLEALSNHFQ